MKIFGQLFYENINNYNFELQYPGNINRQFKEATKVLPNDFQCDRLELRSETQKQVYIKKGDWKTIQDIIEYRGDQMTFV